MGTLGDGDAGASGGPDAKKDDIYENRSGHKKIIRVVTVMAYMVSVSFVAIVLSAYYVFLWQPPNPRLMHRSHLRADPQIQYLVHGPQIESVHEEVAQGQVDDLDKVIVLDEKISIETRPDESSGGSKLLKVIGIDPRSKDEARTSDYSSISTTLRDPIVRALLATTDNPTTDGKPVNSTGVYESNRVAMKSSLRTASSETSNSEINESIRGSSDSTPMMESADKFYDESANHSTSIIENGHKSYDVFVNYSTPTDFGGTDTGNGESDDKSSDNSSEATGANFDRDFGTSMMMRVHEFLENSTLFTPEVNVGTTGTFGNSVTTRTHESVENSTDITPEVRPIPIGLEERSVETSGKSVTMRKNETVENSTDITPEVRPIPIGLEERSVETSEKSVTMRKNEIVENSTDITPEVRPIPIGLAERSVETFGKSVTMRKNEMVENSTDITPEVRPIPIGLKERSVETSGKSVTMRKNETVEDSTNITPEVQAISVGLEERSVESVKTSGKSGSAEGQPETLGTTPTSVQQRNFDWKPLLFTEPSTKIGELVAFDDS